MAAASKKLIEAFVDLLNILECPVCLKYGSSNPAPIKICTQGHFTCGDCARNLDLCPTCRGQYSNVRPTILDQIIEAILYPCGNIGCDKMLPVKDIYQHELECNLQEKNHIKYDKKLIQSQNILKHIEDNYSYFYLKQGDDVTEMGLCLNCLFAGLCEETDELKARINQQINLNHSRTEVPGSMSSTICSDLQASDKDYSHSNIQDKPTKEIGIQCNLMQVS